MMMMDMVITPDDSDDYNDDYDHDGNSDDDDDDDDDGYDKTMTTVSIRKLEESTVLWACETQGTQHLIEKIIIIIELPCHCADKQK